MIDTTLGLLVVVIAVLNVYWAARLYALNTLTGTPEVVAAVRTKSKRLQRWSRLSGVAAFSLAPLHLIFRSM